MRFSQHLVNVSQQGSGSIVSSNPSIEQSKVNNWSLVSSYFPSNKHNRGCVASCVS